MPHPFRFGVQLHQPPADRWAERALRIEALGYSTIFFPDHFGSQWDPTTGMTAMAAITERLNVGALVYDVDYRHPVIYAKSAATLQLLSGGRHEFGLGAGWMQSDYDQAGLSYDSPGTRIERLDEALQIIRSMWVNEKTSFEGKHYQIRDIARAVPLPEGAKPPRVLVGGGGKRLLGVAARHADIIGINPSLHEGRVGPGTAADLAPERVQEKIRWVHEAADRAGRDITRIELNSLVFAVAITDTPQGFREALARNTGMSVEQITDCPLFLTGSAAEIRDRLEKRRESLGQSYIVIQGDDEKVVERFAEHVVAPLAGH